MSRGVELIAAERARQVQQEGWSPEHDDAHTDGVLAVAAAELAAHPYAVDHDLERDHCGSLAKHRDNPIRRLTIAGALIAAEIDRLDRMSLAASDLCECGHIRFYHDPWFAGRREGRHPCEKCGCQDFKPAAPRTEEAP